jgi:hypothetical protein
MPNKTAADVLRALCQFSTRLLSIEVALSW